MQLITVNLPYDHNVFFFGDRHGDSALSSESGWEHFIEMVHSPYDGCKNNVCAEGGDDIEAIMVDDKRFDPERMKNEPLPLMQIENAIRDRQKIKKQLLYKLMGNHEFGLRRFGDVMAKICKELEVPYGTYSTKLTVLDKKDNLMYKSFDTHGRKGISSTADDPLRRRTNLNLTLKRHLKFKAGDCAVMVKHHVHKLLACKPEPELYLVDNGESIKQNYTSWGQGENYIHPDARWYGCAGSFLKLFGDGMSGYAELAEYDPVELGFLVLKVRDRKIISLDQVRLDV